MDVAARDCVADPIQLELARGVRSDGLRLHCQQLPVINSAEVVRERHQVEVQLVVRQRAVLDDDVVDTTLDLEVGILAPQSRDSSVPIGVGSDLDESEAESHGDVVLGERAQVRRRVHAAHQGREQRAPA